MRITYRLLIRQQPRFLFLAATPQQLAFALHGRLLLLNQKLRVRGQGGGKRSTPSLSFGGLPSSMPTHSLPVPILSSTVCYWRTSQAVPASPSSPVAEFLTTSIPASAMVAPWADTRIVDCYNRGKNDLESWFRGASPQVVLAQLGAGLSRLWLAYTYVRRLYCTIRSVNADGWP